MALLQLQCDWGDKVGTEEDDARCGRTAVGVVAVKDGRKVHALNVCMSHRMVLMDETSPVGRG